jgi:hypothetical protein
MAYDAHFLVQAMVAALSALPHTHQPAMEKFESDAIFFIMQAQVCIRFRSHTFN